MKNMFLMVVKGDSNDGNYAISTDEVNSDYLIVLQKWMLEYNPKENAIDVDSFKKEMMAKGLNKQLEFFEQLLPRVSYPNKIHTVEEIIFYEITKKITLI